MISFMTWIGIMVGVLLAVVAGYQLADGEYLLGMAMAGLAYLCIFASLIWWALRWRRI